MKVTKAELEQALAQAAEFNQRELQYVLGIAAHTVCSRPGFVPVCRYGRGMLPLRGELGANGAVRYINPMPENRPTP